MSQTARRTSVPAGLTEHLSAAVVIPTYNRPEHLEVCLRHIDRQTVKPVEIVVVDASPDHRTEAVVANFAHVRYARNHLGRGHTAMSRAIGMDLTTAPVLAFVDDDAYAESDWLAELLARYESGVAAVGGRARNGIAGEEREGVSRIGKLLDNGILTGNFSADPGQDVEVDHLLGANMSVRRSVVEEIGGIHDHYPGTCLREETDIALRMRKAGYRVVYVPSSVVHHVAGPYAKGRRFDTRYKYYAARNHMVLLIHSMGFRDPRTRRYLRVVASSVVGDLNAAIRAPFDRHRTDARSKVKGMGGGILRAAVNLAGSVLGIMVGGRLALYDDPQGARLL